jgi:hypothetical protein
MAMREGNAGVVKEGWHRVLLRSRAAGIERQQGCAQSGSPTAWTDVNDEAESSGASAGRRLRGPSGAWAFRWLANGC